jgi:3-oxoacyl-(acyl-carrier-protein) synthase
MRGRRDVPVKAVGLRPGREPVVVTGIGVVSPIGNGADAFWKALGERAGADCQAAVEAIVCEADGRVPRTAGRIGRLALAAGALALDDARRSQAERDAADAGVFLGANLDDINLVGLCRSLRAAGGSLTNDPDWGEFTRRAREHLHPFDYLQALSNMPAAHLAIRYGVRGPCSSSMAHGISGIAAIGDAYVAVRDGTVAWALAGGADSWLTPWAVWRRGVLGGSAQGRCRPFSGRRSRPRLGEGAAVLVLEPIEAARARSAHIYAEVAGYATTLDSAALPAPAGGSGLARCITAALTEASIAARDVAYLSAHGEGSVDGDRLEARALREVFGTSLPPLGCVKGRTGHLGAASGAVEAAATALVIERQHVPDGARPQDIDPDLDLPEPGVQVSGARIAWALNIAHHQLGLSAALVFRRSSAATEMRTAGS